jgi:hypothetical protein
MGFAVRVASLYLAAVTFASAQPGTIAFKATANLDALARSGVLARRPSRAPKPQRSTRRTGVYRSSIARPDGSDPAAGYSIYGGFPALLDSYVTTPPDTGGAVGPRHVVTTTNAQVLIQSRTGEVRPNYPLDLNRFWSPLGDFTDTFDPRIQYDPQTDRWLASAGVNAGKSNAALLVGVSATGDPGGDWYLFRIDEGPAGFWADYPVLGFNANWVVLAANIYTLPPGAYDRTDVYVFQKSDLYANGTGAYQTFSDDQGEFTLARDYDNGSPSAFYLVQAFGGSESSVRVSTITGPSGQEQFHAGAGVIPLNDSWAEAAPAGDDFAPQYASWAKVDTGDSRLQNCALRQGAIWCAHTVFLPADKPVRAAVQWFQIDPVAIQLLQAGRIEDPAGAVFYGFPSIAVNRNNEALIGFTRFSRNGFPDGAFALRGASDPLNTVRAATVFKRGEAPFIGIGADDGSNRWGDFSATVVDPLDDTAFWTIQEYASTPTNGYLGRWGTWWSWVVPPSAGLNCTYSVAASNAAFDAGGGSATISVATQPGCPWMAAADSGWIAVRGGSPGQGSGTVAFSVAPNTGSAALTGTITIAGQAVKIAVRNQ